SRRRHTRSDRDWSSDVCSSDLTTSNGNYYVTESGGTVHEVIAHGADKDAANQSFAMLVGKHVCVRGTIDTAVQPTGGAANVVDEIGRASCRERVKNRVVAG